MGRTIRLTNGDDTFRQGLSFQNQEITILALDGNDRIVLDRDDDFGGGNTVSAGAGRDVVVNHDEGGNLISLGSANDIYIGAGFGSFIPDSPDTVSGGLGNDRFFFKTFKSLYKGGAGNDKFFSVGLQNVILGGRGIDTLSYAPRDDSLTQGGRGVTVDLLAGRVQTGANRFETIRSIENVIGSGANDALFGTNGRNVLTGGQGFDQLTGRGGADTFLFRSAAEAAMDEANIDLITDFNAAQGDRIHLARIDANTNAGRNQAFRFIDDADFSGRAGELQLERDGQGNSILQGDVNGDGLADFRIGLIGVTDLSTDSILL